MPKKSSKASRKTGKKLAKKRVTVSKIKDTATATLPPQSVDDATGVGEHDDDGEYLGESE